MGCLIPTLAFHPLDFVDVVGDGLDALLEHREVGTIRQALHRGREVKIGFQYAILVRTLVTTLRQSRRASSASVAILLE